MTGNLPLRPSLLLLAALAVAMVPGPVPADPVPTSDPQFCVRVQQMLAGTAMVPAENVIHPDYAAYRYSKTQVNPLTTHQYTMPEPGTTDRPWRLSCKVKTPDHLNAEYGPGTAHETGLDCRDVNRQTVRAVYGGLTPEERARVQLTGDRILLEPDIATFMGSSFVGDYPFAWTDAEGRLHLQAKRLRVDWDDPWFAWAPEKLRGAIYCHLAAPEYLRRLALGEETAPPLEDWKTRDD